MSAETTYGIVIVAAGRGERAGASEEGPKQYRRIGGRSVIAHTLARFTAWRRSGPVVLVIHPDDADLCRKALAELPVWDCPSSFTAVLPASRAY